MLGDAIIQNILTNIFVESSKTGSLLKNGHIILEQYVPFTTVNFNCLYYLIYITNDIIYFSFLFNYIFSLKCSILIRIIIYR
jgi:hypothetical protein